MKNFSWTYTLKLCFVILSIAFLSMSIYYMIKYGKEINNSHEKFQIYVLVKFVPAFYAFGAFVVSLYSGILINAKHSWFIKSLVIVLNLLLIYKIILK